VTDRHRRGCCSDLCGTSLWLVCVALAVRWLL
jgi:hypothetical protein